MPAYRGASAVLNANYDLNAKLLLTGHERSSALGAQAYSVKSANAAALGFLIDKRFWFLLTSLIRFFVASLWDFGFLSTRMNVSQFARHKAHKLRQLLVELGPIFIKLGQFISMRRDLISAELAEELSLLQDNVPPFDIDSVKKTFLLDFGLLPTKLFKYFENSPIASGSIGQVHKAQLINGDWVAVKVQRPGLAEVFLQDIGYMRLCTVMLQFFGVRKSISAWLEVIDEFGAMLFAEIDYLNEGRNADKFRRFLYFDTRIKIPRVYWKYTSRKVLCMQYLPGTKIDQVKQLRKKGVDLRGLCQLLVDCYVQQVLRNGYFHSDPHSANFAVDENGYLIIYDFGAMGQLTKNQRLSISAALHALVSSDAEKLAYALIQLGLIKDDLSAKPLSKCLKPFVEYCGGNSHTNIDFNLFERDFRELINKHAINLPASLTCFLRMVTVLEGCITMLKPNFNFNAAMAPVLRYALVGENHN